MNRLVLGLSGLALVLGCHAAGGAGSDPGRGHATAHESRAVGLEYESRGPSSSRAPTKPGSSAHRRPIPRSRTLGGPRQLSREIARLEVSACFDSVELEVALRQIARSVGFELLLDDGAVDGLVVTARLESVSLEELLAHFEELYPVSFTSEGRFVRVGVRSGPRLALLIYPVPHGFVTEDRPANFDSLRQLSFVSRSNRSRGGADESRRSEEASGPARSRLQLFLDRVPDLWEWPEGSAWYLDTRLNLLFVRAPVSTVDQVEECLDDLCQPPALVEIEARFVELSDGWSRDLGVEFELIEDYALREKDGEPQLVLGEGSGSLLGLPQIPSGQAAGLELALLGLLTRPSFGLLLRALEETGQGEILSAPGVTTVNNSTATLAITTNLPFVEDYRPVFDRDLVASDGLSTSETEVALVAQINDENFTGIVLNVTPSVGGDSREIVLRLQPVVRTQVGSIEISSGAVVQGVETPAIARPIIETRFLDTQLAIPDGGTLVLGGLESTVAREDVTGVPILRSIPILGRLFERRVVRSERRDLVIFVTARIVR